jgi:hypothetical protein
MSLTDLRCPSCSAPLPVPEGRSATCDYCHVTSVLDASGVARIEDAGGAQEGSPFGRRFLGLLRILVWAAYGFVAVAIPVAYARGESGELVIGYAIALGLGTLVALAERQKLLGTVVCALGGGLLLVKPWAQPLILSGKPFSPTSETACYFSVPGGFLLLLALLIGLSLRRGDLRPGWPRRSTLLLVGVGALVACYGFSRPTRTQVAAEHRAEWETLRTQVAQAIKTSPAASESGSDYSGLRFEDDDPRGTNSVQFLSWEQLEDSYAGSGHYYPGGQDLREAWQAAGVGDVLVNDANRSRRASEPFLERVRRARRASYLVVYRVGEGQVEVFLYDLKGDALRLRERVECAEPNGILEGPRAVLGFLSGLPGAEVVP